jgi:hypothetical protein
MFSLIPAKQELQREMEEIPFEELRAMQREEGIGIRRRRVCHSTVSFLLTCPLSLTLYVP